MGLNVIIIIFSYYIMISIEPKGSIMNPVGVSDDILEEIEKKTKKQTMEDLVIKLKDHLTITKSKQEPLFETYTLHQLYKCCDVYGINKNPLRGVS